MKDVEKKETEVKKSEGFFSDIKNYFSSNELAFYIFIIILSLLFRWIGLGDRPIHHDEAIHLTTGYNFFEAPDRNFYKYDPMTHGPFLYHSLRLVFSIFGYSVEAGRGFMAFIGTVFLFMPLLFRKYFKPKALIFLTLLIGLSPSMIFWSRFVRSDMLMLSWWLMILCGVVLAPPKWNILLVIVGVGLQLCTKENSYVFYAMMLGYMIFEYLFYFFAKYDTKDTFIIKISKSIKNNWQVYLMSLVIICAIIYYFFSAGFRYFTPSPSWFENAFGTFLDGLYRKSIGYWMHHHGIERIKGPFNFQFYMMAWYDFVLVLCMLAHIIYLSCKKLFALCCFAVALIIAIIFAATNTIDNHLANTWIWNFFKLKNSYDFFGLFILPTYAFVVTFYHLLKKERTLAFFGFFAGANLATYCYLGEKVPWLSVYPIISFMIYYTLLFNKIISSPICEKLKKFNFFYLFSFLGALFFILGLIFILEDKDANSNLSFCTFGFVIVFIGFLFKDTKVNLLSFIFLLFFVYDVYVGRIINFNQAGSEKEVMSQVHTTQNLQEIFDDMKSLMKKQVTQGRDKYLFYVKGETSWPSCTYFIGYDEIVYDMGGRKPEDFKYLIEDQESTRREKNLKSIIDGHEDEFYTKEIKTRCWFDPDYRKMTLKNFLNYAINHEPWSDVGFFHATYHVRKEDK